MEQTDKWIADNYENILQWAKQISYNHQDYIDLAHDVIIAFKQHDKADQLVEQGQARFFITRMLLNQGRSHSSPFNRNHRISHQGIVFSDEVVEEYDIEIDLKIESIQAIMEEITVESTEGYYCMTILQLLMEQPRVNFSELERDTNIPRSSISQAYYTAIEMIKERLQRNAT